MNNNSTNNILHEIEIIKECLNATFTKNISDNKTDSFLHDIPTPIYDQQKFHLSFLLSNSIDNINIKKINDDILIKSFWHNLLMSTISDYEYLSNFDIITELNEGPIEKLSNSYIYPNAVNDNNPYDYSYLSYRQHILIQPIDISRLRQIRNNFQRYILHKKKYKRSCLPTILCMLRLSLQKNLLNTKTYYIVLLTPYPFNRHHVHKSILYCNNDINTPIYYDNSQCKSFNPKYSFQHKKISHSIVKYKKYNNDEWNFVNNKVDQIDLFTHLSNDIDFLASINIINYGLCIIGAESDLVFGKHFKPGQEFGPLNELDKIPLERRPTFRARHDNSLLDLDHQLVKITTLTSIRLATSSSSSSNTSNSHYDSYRNSIGNSLVKIPYAICSDIEYYVSIIDIFNGSPITRFTQLFAPNSLRYASHMKEKIKTEVLSISTITESEKEQSNVRQSKELTI